MNFLRSQTLALAMLLLPVAVTAPLPRAAHAESSTAAGAAAAGTTSAENETLRTVMATMAKFTSYHAKAVILIGKQKAQLEGDWAVGKVAFDLQRMDGKSTRNIVIGDTAFVSPDAGKTWQPQSPESSVFLSRIVIAPLSPGVKLADQGPVKSLGAETIEGVKTTHLQLQAKSPVDIWVAEDKALGKVVRKAHMVVQGEEGDIDATVIYSAYNKPVQISAPAVK